MNLEIFHANYAKLKILKYFRQIVKLKILKKF